MKKMILLIGLIFFSAFVFAQIEELPETGSIYERTLASINNVQKSNAQILKQTEELMTKEEAKQFFEEQKKAQTDALNNAFSNFLLLMVAFIIGLNGLVYFYIVKKLKKIHVGI